MAKCVPFQTCRGTWLTPRRLIVDSAPKASTSLHVFHLRSHFRLPLFTNLRKIEQSPTMPNPSDRYAAQALERLDILNSHLSSVQPPPGRLTKLSRSLQGRKAIVTGAASGMGRETAKLLADEGVQVAVLDLEGGRVQVVVEEINAVHPGRARGWVCDVADRSRIKEVCGEITEAFGGLDVRAITTPRSLIIHPSLITRPTDPDQQRRHLPRWRRLRRGRIIRVSLG